MFPAGVAENLAGSNLSTIIIAGITAVVLIRFLLFVMTVLGYRVTVAHANSKSYDGYLAAIRPSRQEHQSMNAVVHQEYDESCLVGAVTVGSVLESLRQESAGDVHPAEDSEATDELETSGELAPPGELETDYDSLGGDCSKFDSAEASADEDSIAENTVDEDYFAENSVDEESVAESSEEMTEVAFASTLPVERPMKISAAGVTFGLHIVRDNEFIDSDEAIDAGYWKM